MNLSGTSMTRWHAIAGIATSALLLGLYARGGLAWPLGLVLLLPWLWTLDHTRSVLGSLFSGWLMSVAYVLAVFAWFGTAVDTFTGIGGWAAMLALCTLAPLLQPQVLAFVLVRHLLGRAFGPWLRALGAASAWVACEWAYPKLLGDTLGHGLYPSPLLRQLADLGGAAGLTFLLILINEALALTLTRWRSGARVLPPLALVTALLTVMLGYGQLRLSTLQTQLSEPAPSIRIGMVQSAIVDYEKLRQERGAYAVVREVLDTHFALSRAAIEQHQVDALMWSETVYPTTFGHPRSEDGAALDQEILDFVGAVGVPLVFGSYDVDDNGEYNAAVFIEPDVGLLGYYRKSYPFPLTEHVPAWIDGPLLRHWLPWTGNWQPGSGARVFPLRTSDGRELNVLPLICLDAVHPNLAIDGARLGAQMILGLSNDSWFSADPLGARLHLAVAAFSSIETRLPQLRVTNNGLSAIIDPTGAVLASTQMGDRAVLAGDIPLRDPPATLMLRWGDWVGGAGLAFLSGLLALLLVRFWRTRLRPFSWHETGADYTANRPFKAPVVTLSPIWRGLAALLRLSAGMGLLWLAALMLLCDGLQVNSLAQIQIYGWLVLLPAFCAWAIQQLHAASASVEGDLLVFRQRSQRIEIPIAQISSLHVWRIPLPKSGIDLQFISGRRWGKGIALADPKVLLHALAAAGSPVQIADRRSQVSADFAALRAATVMPRLDHPFVKFVLFPLIPALPAFRLHQIIAFGDTFGEYYTYGLWAYLQGLMIWWAAWSIGLMLFAALLRLVIEVATVLLLRWRTRSALGLRRTLQNCARLIFYPGVPAWLILRILSN